MKIIDQSYEILSAVNGEDVMRSIELAARTCYKSEDKIGPGTADVLVRSIVDRGHDAMVEFADMTVKFVTNRGVSHELVRHRVASFAQESTRYCNYSKGKFDGQLTFIQPTWYDLDDISANALWGCAVKDSEIAYFSLLRAGWKPEQAREILPNSLKTEIVVKANMREWRHIFKLRTAKAAHPQMRALMQPLLSEMQEILPVLFGDIGS